MWSKYSGSKKANQMEFSKFVTGFSTFLISAGTSCSKNDPESKVKNLKKVKDILNNSAKYLYKMSEAQRKAIFKTVNVILEENGLNNSERTRFCGNFLKSNPLSLLGVEKMITMENANNPISITDKSVELNKLNIFINQLENDRKERVEARGPIIDKEKIFPRIEIVSTMDLSPTKRRELSVLKEKEVLPSSTKRRKLPVLKEDHSVTNEDLDIDYFFEAPMRGGSSINLTNIRKTSSSEPKTSAVEKVQERRAESKTKVNLGVSPE